MYDSFSSDYDRFVSWPGRLAFELPFLQEQLAALTSSRPVRVLDAACGTGMHAITLAQKGYQVAGADLSAAMVAKARQNAAAAGVEVRFEAAGFGALQAALAGSPLFPFDAVLCLGNSLPHLLTPQALAGALADFAACLRPGGLVILQNRNFDAVMASRQRWMEPQAHHEGEAEWLFLRFYDFQPDGLIGFNILTLRRQAGGNWSQGIASTLLRPLLQAEMQAALGAAGFTDLAFYGGMDGSPFDPAASGNLVMVGKKQIADS